MTDTISREQRSKVMALVRSKDTKPEMAVRRLVHRLGFRYRLHGQKLPGKPDLVFKKRKKVIFVHGCFWHRHENCKQARLPKSNTEFWIEKLNQNKIRDDKSLGTLAQLGWKTLIIWECEIKDLVELEKRIIVFLNEE